MHTSGSGMVGQLRGSGRIDAVGSVAPNSAGPKALHAALSNSRPLEQRLEGTASLMGRNPHVLRQVFALVLL